MTHTKRRGLFIAIFAIIAALLLGEAPAYADITGYHVYGTGGVGAEGSV